MEALTPVKQMFSFQKTFFDNAYVSTVRIQDHAEEWMQSLFKQMPYVPEESKKMFDETVLIGKKARDNFKKAMDDGYEKVEALFAAK